MLPAWWLMLSAALAAARASLQLTAGSPAQVVLAAGIALGALAGIVQVRPFLPPGGLQIAAGLVSLEMGVHALLDGLRRPSGTPMPIPNPTVVLEVGESVAVSILLAWLTNRPVWVGLAVAAGSLTGFLARRSGLTRNRRFIAVFSVWFLGSSVLLLVGRPR